jgi:hypothetical protein
VGVVPSCRYGDRARVRVDRVEESYKQPGKWLINVSLAEDDEEQEQQDGSVVGEKEAGDN